MNRLPLEELKERGARNRIQRLELEDYFDSQRLVVSGKSPDALVLNPGVIRRTFRSVMDGVPDRAPLQEAGIGISGETMAEFDVDNHLQRLAVDFGVTSVLHRAYTKAGRSQ